MDRMDTSDDDDFNAKSEKFLAWLKQNGAIISAKIQLADLRQQNAGRGVVALEDLEEDEELFSIPRSSILTRETSSIPERLQDEIRKELDDPWLTLIEAMSFEYLKGQDSAWKPYFDVLPETFDSLMYWAAAEVDYLQGSAVVHKIGKAGADAAFQERLLGPIAALAANHLLQKPKLSDEDMLALCHRMGSTIMAYAFDLEKTSEQSKSEEDGWEEDEEEHEILPKGMVPMADMLNADADRNNAKLFYEDDKVVMKTIKPVTAGEELYNDFGALPRADLLRRYGYVTENYAKYDVVEVSTELIKAQAVQHLGLAVTELDERLAYLEEQGVLDDGYDISHADSDVGQFPEELSMFVNLLVTPTAEFEKLKKKDKLPRPNLTEQAKSLLRTVLVHRHAMYPDKEPAALQGNDSVKRRYEMARQVIKGEKAVLREAVNTLTPKDNKKRTADAFDEEAAAIRRAKKK